MQELTQDHIFLFEEVSGEAFRGKVLRHLIWVRHACRVLSEPTLTLSELWGRPLAKGLMAVPGSVTLSSRRELAPPAASLRCGSHRNECGWAVSVFCQSVSKGVSFAPAFENKNKFSKAAATLS